MDIANNLWELSYETGRQPLGLERAFLVKGKLKNQRKLVGIEERTASDTHMGQLWEEMAPFSTGARCFSLLSLVSHKTSSYPLMYLLSPPTPSTPLPLPLLEVAQADLSADEQQSHCCCGVLSSAHTAQGTVGTPLFILSVLTDLRQHAAPSQ